ncbi:catalase family peroxidase [Siccirubricoccus sp. KC 17139]|uniref:Catalase-related peroxidase n=1 Tax=Siccirubricoccus soli TaxID=2899147 RepID=A0ABT1D9C3_9PROT|nr:catalase family peroxidase [Siccirubricoccus soli]MCO6418541.1 catalase family peroxidase [Siccirubricoccus soli]MCP2684676.1 catalase family peroxidase [Siccirubricoccus soli]
MPETPPRGAPPSFPLGRLTAIGAVLATLGAGFAYAGGWLSPGRITPGRIVDALSERGGDPTGHRRNHAKGICFTGRFEASGEGARLSTAPMLAAGRYPVVGRFAIGTGDPVAPDASGRVRSMAIRIAAPDGQEWRTGMNNMPVFPVATLEAFYELTLASRVDPATGTPRDPQAVPRFVAAHPEMRAFLGWAGSAPWTPSYAEEDYHALNAFFFVDAAGARRAVRWAVLGTVPPEPRSPAELQALGPDFLGRDLVARLGQGPLRWRMVAQLAGPDDPVDDPTRAWPAEREQVTLGTLVVEQAQPEASGPCRDVNYDPLVLPAGIEPSRDPILLARSPAYAASYLRRQAELGQVPALARGAGAGR